MRNQTVANEQSFQSIYLDPSTDNWQERIVFHDPIFDDEMPGVIALKSLELEDLIGVVIAAPRNVLRNFREQVKERDVNEKWGAEDAATIIAKIVKLAKEMGAVISYEQLGQAVTKQRDPEAAEEDEAHFFDPATQRQIVKKGPHYFDPSLPTVKDVEDLQSKRSAQSSKGNPTNPGIGVYPNDITDEGKGIWDKMMSDHQVRIFKYPANKRRWDFANYLYDMACTIRGIHPYVLRHEDRPSAVLEKLKSSNAQALDILEAVAMSISKQGLLSRSSGREKVRDVRKMKNDYVLTTVKPWTLEGLSTAQQIVNHLAVKHNFITIDDSRCFKLVNPNTQLSVSRDPKNLRRVNVYTIFRIPEKDARMITKSEDEQNIKHRLTKLLDTWVKSGRFS